MAPAKLHREPYEQLVELLACSRAEGLSFEEAWERAVRPGCRPVLTGASDPPAGAVLWPTDSRDRVICRTALLAIKDDIRRAYQRRPATARERSVRLLVAWLSGDEAHRLHASPYAGGSGISSRSAVRSVA